MGRSEWLNDASGAARDKLCINLLHAAGLVYLMFIIDNVVTVVVVVVVVVIVVVSTNMTKFSTSLSL